jgi:hypothetical protein
MIGPYLVRVQAVEIIDQHDDAPWVLAQRSPDLATLGRGRDVAHAGQLPRRGDDLPRRTQRETGRRANGRAVVGQARSELTQTSLGPLALKLGRELRKEVRRSWSASENSQGSNHTTTASAPTTFSSRYITDVLPDPHGPVRPMTKPHPTARREPSQRVARPAVYARGDPAPHRVSGDRHQVSRLDGVTPSSRRSARRTHLALILRGPCASSQIASRLAAGARSVSGLPELHGRRLS